MLMISGAAVNGHTNSKESICEMVYDTFLTQDKRINIVPNAAYELHSPDCTFAMINMSSLNTVETLLNISLNQLCQSMNEDILKYALQLLPPSICIHIMCKILGLEDATHPFLLKLGYDIGQMDLELFKCCTDYYIINAEIFEQFATNQEIIIVDHFNYSSLFDHKLFFKLVVETSLRSYLFVLFQICIQIKGLNFPSNFAQEWINKEISDSNEGICLPYIEEGLKLGIFLGDTGWLVESALVLSHTYEMITTKWVCHDENLKLFKTLQCLTKWLLVTSNYYNFVEAKVVLRNLLNSIDIIEQIEGRALSLSYAYLAVSQYHYVLLEFDKAWSWAVKAIVELHMDSKDVKILILNYSIKLCCELHKVDIAQKLRKQLKVFENDIDHCQYAEMLLSHANYLIKIEVSNDYIYQNYHNALGITRNFFGYYNLHTANILTNYVLAQYEHYRNELNYDESMRFILQAIFIMRKIGVPNDNMLLVKAYQVKSFIIQEIACTLGLPNSYIEVEDDDLGRLYQIEIIKQSMFQQVENIYSNALHVALQSLGENNLLAANIYSYLGTIYIYQEKYAESKDMILKEIEIIRLTLGTNHIKFAISIGHLAYLYSHYLYTFEEAELLSLQAIHIYENVPNVPIEVLMFELSELMNTYEELNNMEIQLFYDGHSTIASSLAARVNVDPPCYPSDRLMSVVTKGLQHETDRQKESEQALNLNPIQQMLIGPGIDVEFETNVICTASEPSLYETVYVTSHKGPCIAGAFSPDGQLIATGSSDTSIKILDVERMLAKAHDIGSTDNQEGQGHSVIRTLYDHLKEVTCLEFHPNKPILASGSRDCHVKLFDYSKTSVKKAFKTIGNVEPITCITFHPLGDFIVMGTNSPVIRLYDINTVQCFVCSVPSHQHTGPVTSIKYEPGARYFVSSSQDGSIKLWDGVSNKCVNTFEKAHDGSQVCSVTFSRNGKYILSSGKDSLVKLWELSTSRCLIVYTGAGTTGKQQHRTKALFNHTEEYIMFPDEATTTLCAWNSRNAFRQQLLSLGHNGPIRSIVHSLNSAAFLTCSDDFRVRFCIAGKLHSIDQFLNIKLTDISVHDPEKYPHMSYVSETFIRGSVVRYVQLPVNHVDTVLLQDAARKETVIR
ncbi:hypothetical protein QTP88_011456 [Uroleucon formosanum]